MIYIMGEASDERIATGHGRYFGEGDSTRDDKITKKCNV
jgi:hypothetical protein